MPGRDLRDPQKLGEFITRNIRPNSTFLKTYDELDSPENWAKVPDYDHGESLATITARKYREELEERAANGDKYARSLLAGEAWNEPTE